MRVDGSLLKDTLLNMSAVEGKNVGLNGSTSMDSSKNVEASKIRPSHGFPRTNVEKSYKDTIGSLEDIQKVGENELLAMAHQNLDYIANTLTTTDSAAAREDGFLPETQSTEAYVTVIDKIKINMAIGNDDFDNYGQALDDKEIAKVTGSRSLAQKISNQMKSLDVPDSEENIGQAMKAVAEGQKLEPLTEGTKKYIIENDVTPTIENLYKAQHGSLKTAQNTLDDKVWEQVRGQAEDFIAEAGLEVDDKTLEDAKWLIANEIPVEANSLYAKDFYDNLSLPVEQDDLVDAALIAMNRGKKPLDGLILGDNLDAKYITSKRQLAEARAIMTSLASRRMNQSGLKADIKELTRNLESLEAEETAYYERLLKAEGIIDKEDSISVADSKEPVEGKSVSNKLQEKVEQLRGTINLAREIKEMPEYLVRRGIQDMTLPQTAQEGRAIKARLESIGEHYETLMTRPRADMGDSINKAFRNIPDILADLKLEDTASNEKAVRILAYNNMQITSDSILEMKNIQLEVTETLELLKPATVLEMIRQDKNPLNMSLNELRNEAIKINEEKDFEDSERYSEFLWKAQNSKTISQEERNQYIEIYRALRSIEKSDGAAIGALVGQNASFTVENLITAVKSRKKQGMDIKVDDKHDIPVASEQLREKLALDNKNILNNQNSEGSSEEKNAALLAGKLLRDISPDKLNKVNADNPVLAQTLEELADQVEAQETSQSEKELNLQYENIRSNRYEAAFTSEEDVIRLLTDNNIPLNLDNLLAARNLQTRRDSRYEKLFRASDAQSMGEIKNQILEKLGESIKSPKEMAEAMEELGDLAENVMKGMINAPEANYLNLQTARLLRSEIRLTMDLAKKEHYDIPVLVGDQVCGMSLKIVRGKRDKGKIDVVFDMGRENGGKVAAELIVKELSVSGMIAAENRDTLDRLEEHEDDLLKGLGGLGLDGKNLELRYVEATDLNVEKFLQSKSDSDNEDTEEYQVQTRQLYGMAKSFLAYVSETIGR